MPPVNGLNHVAFLMPDLEAVMRGSGRMIDAGFPIAWGVGRHGPGDNVFAYFIDPVGLRHRIHRRSAAGRRQLCGARPVGMGLAARPDGSLGHRSSQGRSRQGGADWPCPTPMPDRSMPPHDEKSDVDFRPNPTITRLWWSVTARQASVAASLLGEREYPHAGDRSPARRLRQAARDRDRSRDPSSAG